MNRYKIESYGKLESGEYGYIHSVNELDKTLDFSDIKPDSNGQYAIIDYTTYGDYVGSLVERSNFNVICDDFKEILNVRGLYTVSGYYWSHAILLDLNWLSESVCNEESPDYVIAESLREILEGLQNYPLIDEDDYSQLCVKIEDEDWESFIKHDLIKALAENGIDASDMEDEALYTQYRDVCEAINEYWHEESAVSGYIDTDKIAQNWNSVF